MRLGRSLPLLALLAGCATATSQRRDERPAPTLRLLLATASARSPEVRAVIGRLRDRGVRLKVVDVANGAPAPTAPNARAAARRVVANTLGDARRAYQSLQIARAKQVLDQLWQQLRRDPLRLQPSASQLAQLRLYLAAIALLASEPATADDHFRAALVFDPKLVPDNDLFAPPIRQAVTRHRLRLQRTDYAVASQPPGASVIFDGQPWPAVTPTVVAGAVVGEHLLQIGHPLYYPRADWVRVGGAQTRLVVRLQPRPLTEQIAIAATNSKLLAVVARAHDLQGVVRIDRGKAGLDLSAFDFRGDRPKARRASALSPERAAALIDPPTDHRPSREHQARRSFWRRSWWVWTLVGAAVIATGVVVPIAVKAAPATVVGRDVRVTWSSSN